MASESEAISSSCTSDIDCNSGSCKNGICECGLEHVGSTCQFSNPCLSSPCQNDGRCVPITEDGSFYCDCKLGYIDATCTNQDPCLIKGNSKCLNGSTCRRKDDFEFVCECMYPYTGIYCETYDLCQVDAEECVAHLQTEDPDDPRCSPCIDGAKCYQVTAREHACICETGVNDESCHSSTYQERSHLIPIQETVTNKPVTAWNPIIPSIAITCCALYIVLFIIVVIFLVKVKRRRPRLILCCDLDKFEREELYLISVETGARFKAGTKANVYCFLHGERGLAGPYPLSDVNLRKIHVLERTQEDNYLVSSPNDVGAIDKIILYCEDKHPKQRGRGSWFCQKITVRNIKTDENWFFDVFGWVQPNRHQKRRAEKAEQVRKQEMVKMNCHNFAYQTARNHSFIAPLLNPTPVRITLAFVEIMLFMLLLLVFYGFLLHPDIITGEYTLPSDVVWKKGSFTGIIVFIAGIVYAILFTIINSERIPTLLIWKIKEEISAEKFRDVGTNTDPPIASSRKRKNVPTVKESLAAKGKVFRIPSTDIATTEAWLSDVNAYENPSAVSDTRLVHGYDNNQANPAYFPDKIVKYGVIGSLRDNRQKDPTTFIYKTNSIRGLESAMKNDIRAAYEDFRWGPSRGASSVYVMHSPQESEFSNASLSTVGSISNFTLAGGDFGREKEKFSNEEDAKNYYCALCEMGQYRFNKKFTKCFRVMAWMLAISTILMITVLCCVFGGRYGDERTYRWCISLAIAFGEDFLLYQFVKIIFLMAIFTILVKKRKIPTYEARKISERFQVYRVQGHTVLPETFTLKYVKYLPNVWKPIPDQVILEKPDDTDKITHVEHKNKNEV